MRKVFWTQIAVSNFDDNIQYLKVEWNDSVVFKFISKTSSVIEILKRNPMAGAWDNEIGCNKILVTKHIYLFYELKDNNIYLLKFWNNHQKPFW